MVLAFSQAGQVRAQVGAQAPRTPQAPAAPAAPTTAPAAFGEAAPAGTEAPAAYSPTMLGDSVSYFSTGLFNFPITTSSLQALKGGINIPGIPPILIGPFTPSGPGAILAPVAGLSGSAFKIADNEGALPMDRLFLDVNYFAGVFDSLRPGDFPRLRFTRYMLGTERAFLDSDASIGIRVPMFQLNDSLGNSSNTQLGDVTLVTKYAMFRDQDSGSVLSGGVALTLPTGPAFPVFEVFLTPGLAPNPAQVDSINPTIIQPWVGGLLRPSEDAFVQGFTSLALPTDDSVPTVCFADLGVGYFAYRGDDLAVIPTVEEHFTFGLGQRGSQGFPVGVIDTVVTTIGAHLVFRNSAVLTLGYEFPVTGPQPFSSELVAQFNLLR